MSRNRRQSRSTGHIAQPPVVTEQLGNGLRIVVCPRPSLAQAHVTVLVGTGSRHELPHENGITHALEHMLFRGTASYADAMALNTMAESWGGFLEGATYRDHMEFSTGCHPKAIHRAIDLLGEMFTAPRYQGFEIERTILKEELLESLDAKGKMTDLDNIAHRAIFGPRGLGLPIEGSLENLARYSITQLDAHRCKHVVGTNMVIGIAGPVLPEKVVKRLTKVFGSMPKGERPTYVPSRLPNAEPTLRFVRNASSQVDMRLTFRALHPHHPDYAALAMLGRVLGDGMASRMHAELVDRQGLAYALNAGLTTYEECGLFEIDITVAPHRAAEAVRAVLDFTRGASRFRYTPKELTRSCQRYAYGVAFMDDSASELASWHGGATLFETTQLVRHMGARLRRVTAANVRKAAKNVFVRKGFVLTAVGQLARGEWGGIKQVVADF